MERSPDPSPADPRWTMLAFAAEHRFVITAQLAVAAGVSRPATAARLRGLLADGLLHSERHLHRGPTALQITRAGLRAIDSPLPAPRPVDLSQHRHDLGLGWLMLMARRGRFGSCAAVVGEREMRSRDRREDLAGDKPGMSHAPGTDHRGRFGVRLAGEGPAGGARIHYPDLLLITPRGRRVAIELELSTKSPSRRERILTAYSLDRQVDAVLYLVDSRRAGEAIARSASRVGVRGLVHVQSVSFPRSPARGGRARTRVAARGTTQPREGGR